MTINLGLALEDVGTAVLVCRRALEKRLGIELPL
jgi:ornithine cyclodeaminase/alanine dehydrogenase-like protein (mu-crystallin family)